MEGLADLFKQIGNIDSTVKLIAFLASILLLIVAGVLKNSATLSKQAANLLLFLFGAVFLIALTAMILGRSPASDKLTLTLTVTNDARIPYTSDQIELNVRSTTASMTYSPQALSWAIVFHASELPKDRAISLFAQTRDTSYLADTLVQLTNDPFQTFVMRLQKRSHGPGPERSHDPGPGEDRSDGTFWINLPDESIRQAIAKLTGLSYDPGSHKNKVVVTYESSRIQRHGNIYSFVSSPPLVLIDGKGHSLDNCTIPEMEPNATRDIETIKSYAQAQSMAVATTYLRKNPEVLARWIKP
ncbi:MAG: hypothetical protein Q8927_06435 [Bacteroidota bacterium]|nr:hypothetical protein [Bacteroidota bacterium]MDP4215820.1 hypothetical protein [Bacteroidota bacterium]MDP4247971.1 hypothetical protein [Bacteroidota bacterium]MDP4255590.1 hypothetical protein [Bacteroidota bacterium]MDP4260799.1 hypothetical protein [Bacteroidota bacterium]